MIEIRFHGIGVQGTVIASKILADAVSKENKFVQAFPEFGTERRGAPVKPEENANDAKEAFDDVKVIQEMFDQMYIELEKRFDS